MAEAHAKNHDFHILSPSPWPLLGAFSGFLMAFGAVFWMKSLQIGTLRPRPLHLRRRHDRRALCDVRLVA